MRFTENLSMILTRKGFWTWNNYNEHPWNTSNTCMEKLEYVEARGDPSQMNAPWVGPS
jgi:hypothetical protein